MTLTRRCLIAAVAGAGVGQWQIARGQNDRLRIERHGDPQRPAVALYLPGAAVPASVIEMPEHAWRKQKPSDEPVWFYKMYSSDPKFQGVVTWSETLNSLSYAMTTPAGFTMQSQAILQEDGVEIRHEIKGPFGGDTAVVEAPTCVKLYRPFTDVFLERTYVHHAAGLELIASETPERLTKNAEEWLPCRYIVNCGPNGRPPDKRIERVDGVTRYFKSRLADAAFLATESQPFGWVAATHGLNCPSLFTNPARTCHHADPEVQVKGDRAVLNLKVYVIRGSVLDAWQRVAPRDRAGLV